MSDGAWATITVAIVVGSYFLWLVRMARRATSPLPVPPVPPPPPPPPSVQVPEALRRQVESMAARLRIQHLGEIVTLRQQTPVRRGSWETLQRRHMSDWTQLQQQYGSWAHAIAVRHRVRTSAYRVRKATREEARAAESLSQAPPKIEPVERTRVIDLDGSP